MPVRKAIDAANAGDREAFLALFSPVTGYVNDWGREFHGTDAIGRWSDTAFIGKHVKINVINFYLTGNGEIVVIAEVATDNLTGAYSLTFAVTGNQLASFRI